MLSFVQQDVMDMTVSLPIGKHQNVFIHVSKWNIICLTVRLSNLENVLSNHPKPLN